MAVGCGVLALAAFPISAQAAEKIGFDLAAGDAAITLKEYIAASGGQVFFMVKQVRGVLTNPVKGEYTAREALDRMVAHTGLVVVQDEKTGALTITRPASDPAATENSPTPQKKNMKTKTLATALAGWLALAPAGTQAQTVPAPPPPPASGDSTVVLDEFTVTSDQDKGYGTTHSIGASRVDVSVMDTPGTVVTINQQLMKDLGTTEVIDAARFVAGVAVVSSPMNGQMSVRGQNIEGPSTTNGLPEISSAGLSGVTFLDMATTERIEVIEGPEGVLYGSQSVGGIVNRVPKMPLPYAAYNTSATITTANGYEIDRGDIDATGPIDSGAKWEYRVIGAASGGLMWNGRKYDRNTASPILSFSPDKDTKIWVRYEYQWGGVANGATAWFIPIGGTAPTWLPTDRVSSDPWDFNKIWQQFFETGAQHRFFDGHWTSKLNFRLQHQNNDNYTYVRSIGGITFYSPTGVKLGTDQTLPPGLIQDPANFGSIILSRQYEHQTDEIYGRSLYWDNVINFDLGPSAHKLLAFASITSAHTEGATYLSSVANAPTFNFLAPVYNGLFNPTDLPMPVSSNTTSEGRSYAYGAQDNISFLNDRVVLVGGARRDKTWGETFNRTTGNTTYNPADGQNSYKIGLVVKPIQDVSLFYDYSQTFTPQFGSYYAYPTGVLTAKLNEIGAENEYGVKFDFFGSRLVATVSAFDITLDNQLGAGPAVNGVATSLTLGPVQTTGWDMNLTYSPVDNVAMIVGIGDLHSLTNTGIWARGVGQGFDGRAFVTYSVPGGIFKGLMAGVGFQYVPVRAGDALDDFHLDPYWTFNGLLSYRLNKQWSFQVNGYNLANRVYAATGVSTVSVYPGDPRTLRFSIHFAF